MGAVFPIESFPVEDLIYLSPALLDRSVAEIEGTIAHEFAHVILEHHKSDGKMQGDAKERGLNPERRRCAVEHAREHHRFYERRACRLLGQWRGTQRYITTQRDDEDA